ncbi:hypothetical protein EI94DRAFT_1727847, partial [Lactarius quietus]
MIRYWRLKRFSRHEGLVLVALFMPDSEAAQLPHGIARSRCACVIAVSYRIVVVVVVVVCNRVTVFKEKSGLLRLTHSRSRDVQQRQHAPSRLFHHQTRAYDNVMRPCDASYDRLSVRGTCLREEAGEKQQRIEHRG